MKPPPAKNGILAGETLPCKTHAQTFTGQAFGACEHATRIPLRSIVRMKYSHQCLRTIHS